MLRMKMGRFHSLCVISIIFFLIQISVISDTNDLLFTIINVENIHTLRDKSSDGAKGNRFYFRLSLQIENPTNEIISIQHNNSCGFEIYITYAEHQNWDSRMRGNRLFLSSLDSRIISRINRNE